MDDIFAFHEIKKRLTDFFLNKGFIEVPAQSRISILAACEDPSTVTSYCVGGNLWPLPQTGQMWLEHELLKNPTLPGVFCVTTSYRDEKNPIPGRHDIVFPMFEFEAKGGFDELKTLEKELIEFLGFGSGVEVDYEEVCKSHGAEVLEAEHEELLNQKHGSVVFLQKFPQRTSPFWNMKHFENGIFNKVDVLLCGMETIGSAERSCDIEEMRENFLKISDGKYAQLLFDKFGKERVMRELYYYLSLKMFPRFGGGIGVTRLARAMKMEGLL
jgi:aspartyl/asparaginyl-tRNA synthetase